jgi:hypothetical protein
MFMASVAASSFLTYILSTPKMMQSAGADKSTIASFPITLEIHP